MGNTTEGQDAIKRDLNKLERWATLYFMMFNKERGKVLHLEEEHFPGELKEIEHDSTLSANKVICTLDCIRQHIVKGCDPLPPLSTDEITQGILRIVPVPLECKGHGHT